MPMVTLQSPDHRQAKLTHQIGVLAECLLAAAPPRVAENIDVRRPEREALVLAAMPRGDRGMVLGPRLVCDYIRHPVHKRAVPGGAEADHLREHRRPAVAGDAVSGLIPPVVGRQAQAFDGLALMEHLADFFLKGEAAEEILDAPV